MASFKELVETSRQSEDVLRNMVNMDPQVAVAAPLENDFGRELLVKQHLKEVGLYTWLEDAVEFIKNDGHGDVTLEYNLRGPVSLRTLTAKERYYGAMHIKFPNWIRDVKPDLVDSVGHVERHAIDSIGRWVDARFRFDKAEVETNKTCSQFGVRLYPAIGVARVDGAESIILSAFPEDPIDPIQAALVLAYKNPARRIPFDPYPKNMPPSISDSQL